MLKIYLADLANDFVDIDNKSIPIGIGYVGAYCKQQFKDDVYIFLDNLVCQCIEYCFFCSIILDGLLHNAHTTLL